LRKVEGGFFSAVFDDRSAEVPRLRTKASLSATAIAIMRWLGAAKIL